MTLQVAELAAQEEELAYACFDHRSAWELGSILVRLAQERSLRVAVGIDLGDQEVFRCGLVGSSADNDSWLRRKFAVVSGLTDVDDHALVVEALRLHHESPSSRTSPPSR